VLGSSICTRCTHEVPVRPHPTPAHCLSGADEGRCRRRRAFSAMCAPQHNSVHPLPGHWFAARPSGLPTGFMTIKYAALGRLRRRGILQGHSQQPQDDDAAAGIGSGAGAPAGEIATSFSGLCTPSPSSSGRPRLRTRRSPRCGISSTPGWPLRSRGARRAGLYRRAYRRGGHAPAGGLPGLRGASCTALQGKRRQGSGDSGAPRPRGLAQ
jgi:hypothetical protein